jgi:uncharacterized protein with HEPN domain
VSEVRLADYLTHIRQAAGEALEFANGQTRDEFAADRKTQQAVIMSLVVLGEASVRLAEKHPAFVDHHPEVAWRSIRGMRNRIVHGYFDINLDIVRETVVSELPKLIEQISAMQKALPSSE